MSFTALLLGFIAVLNFWIGMYVYRRNSRARSNQAFGFMAISISLWTIALAAAHYGTAGNVWALRTAFAAASFIPLGVLAFVEQTPMILARRSRLRTRLFAPVAITLCASSFSPWIVVSLTPTTHSSAATYGPLHSLFALYVVTCFSYAVWILAVKYRLSTGLTRLQLRYLVLAFAIPSGLATSTNLIVPLLLGTSALSKYGPFFTLPLLGLIGHSIIRHRLLDVRVVIRRSAVYLAAFCCAGLILIGLLAASSAVLHDGHGIPVRETLLALAVAVFFSPLKARIQRALDRYLYREPYDYQRTIREASRALRGTIELTSLLEYVGSLVDRTLRPEDLAIYLFDEDEGHFQLAQRLSGAHFPEILPLSSLLIERVIRHREIIFRDEALATGDALDLEFARLGTEVVVPLVEEEDVIGLLCISPKRSGDPYFSDDADLLATLANQSAVAIRNAQTHQRVLQVNEELQKILSTIESGVIAVGAKGKVTLFNRAAEQLTGRSALTARGQLVRELPAPLAKLIAGTLAAGQRSQVEFSLPDAASQMIPLVCSTAPLLNPSGQAAGAVAVINDLSRLKELEQEKRRAERLASIEAIASGLVHEIRNPLVAIKTFSQLLPVRYQDADFRETFSRTAGREIRRIDELLTRFRTLASASSQPMEPVDVTDSIRHILALIRPQLEERQVRLREVADGAPRPILGNASQLEQLFLNLCLNAVEAMGPGGELTLRMADLCEGGGTTLLVEVSDTGGGIPEDLLARIFDPFVTTKAGGSGLGLAICRGIADAHRAHLSARNNVGRPGSTFTIEFPVPVVVPSTTTAT